MSSLNFNDFVVEVDARRRERELALLPGRELGADCSVCRSTSSGSAPDGAADAVLCLLTVLTAVVGVVAPVLVV